MLLNVIRGVRQYNELYASKILVTMLKSVILQNPVETADHIQPLLCCLQIAELALVKFLLYC